MVFMKHVWFFVFGFLSTMGRTGAAGGPEWDAVATLSASVERGGIRVTVAARPGWSLNTGYPGKLVVGGGSTTLAEARLLDPEPVMGKAHGAVWRLSLSVERSGTAKFVFCNATSCTAPITRAFTVAGGAQ